MIEFISFYEIDDHFYKIRKLNYYIQFGQKIIANIWKHPSISMIIHKSIISSHIRNLITRFSYVHASLPEKCIYDETNVKHPIKNNISYEIWLYVLVTKIPANT